VHNTRQYSLALLSEVPGSQEVVLSASVSIALLTYLPTPEGKAWVSKTTWPDTPGAV